MNTPRNWGSRLIINEKYNLPLPSAEPLVMKAKQMNCDLFISGGVFPDGVMTVKAAKALKYNPKAYFQGVGSAIPAWTKELGEDGNAIVSGTSYHEKLNNPSNKMLIQAGQGKTEHGQCGHLFRIFRGLAAEPFCGS